MRGPERIETARLVLRRPRVSDAEQIFTRYAADPEVTRFLSWSAHRTIDDTRAFLEFSDAEWSRWPAGPYLIECRETHKLLGGTGLAFETSYRAATGYVLATDAWGRGLATEALDAVVGVARSTGLLRLYALTHTEHEASQRVLEKCAFIREGTLRRHSEFPNLGAAGPCDVSCYGRIF